MLKKILKAAVIALIWILIWEAVSLLVGKEVIVPSPLRVLTRLIELAAQGGFWANIGASLLRIMAGYAIALAAGTLLGVLTALVKPLDALLSPAAKIIRATPVASFIILLFVFAAKNNIPAVTAFLMVLPIVWANVHQGINVCDRKLLEMAAVFNFKRRVVLKKIYVPSVMPFFITAARTGIGFAWKAGIAAEVLVNPKFGIGAALYDSKIYLETRDLFAWTVVVIIISMILEKILARYVFRNLEDRYR